MLGFPENGPCLLQSGTVASWELVPLGRESFLVGPGRWGPFFPYKTKNGEEKGTLAAVDLARFRPHKTLTQHVKAPLAPSPSLAGRDRAFPRSGDVNNCAAETGSTGPCSGLPLPSLLSRDHLAPFLAPPWEGHRPCVGLGLHPGQQELLLGTAAAEWEPLVHPKS